VTHFSKVRINGPFPREVALESPSTIDKRPQPTFALTFELALMLAVIGRVGLPH